MTLVGAIAGLLSVLGLLVMFVLYVRQQRAVRDLRLWAGDAPERAREPHAQLVPVAPGGRAARPWRRVAVIAVLAGATATVLGVLVLSGGAPRAVRVAAVPAGHAQPRIDDIADLSSDRRATVPVAVLNGSSIAGLAVRTQQRLTALGFAQGVVANASQPTSAATSVAYADQDAAGPAVAIARLIGTGRPVRASPGQRALARRAEVIVTVGVTASR
jgi:hypothetical protein